MPFLWTVYYFEYNLFDLHLIFTIIPFLFQALSSVFKEAKKERATRSTASSTGFKFGNNKTTY